MISSKGSFQIDEGAGSLAHRSKGKAFIFSSSPHGLSQLHPEHRPVFVCFDWREESVNSNRLNQLVQEQGNTVCPTLGTSRIHALPRSH